MSNEKMANAVEILGGVLSGMDPTAAVGQKQERERESMINESRIPRIWLYGAPRADLLGVIMKWGVGFPEGPHTWGTLFHRVTLPPGWKIVSDPKESMRSFLVDESGRRRASIFYKNSGYDEAVASMTIIPRYSVEDSWDGVKTGKIVARVMDGGITELHRVEVDATDLDQRGRFSLLMVTHHEAECWLGGRFPRWQDPAFYWGK